MTRDRHQDEIDTYLNALARGERNPDAGDLSPETVAEIRHLHELLHAPLPAGAVTRLRMSVMAEIERSYQSPREDSMTHSTTLVTPWTMPHANGRHATLVPDYAEKSNARIARAIGALAIAAVTALLLFGFYQFNGGNNGAVPPASSSPAPEAERSPASGQPVQFVWSSQPSGDDALFHPLTIRLAPDGKLWVADGTNRWFIFDLDGSLLETWGEAGSGPGQFNFRKEFGPGNFGETAGIAFAADGSFYISDPFNYRIQRFDAQRNFVSSWGTEGEGNGQFKWPAGVSISANGQIMVADIERGDVQWFQPDGTYVKTINAAGTREGRLVTPSIAIEDENGRLLIPELEANRIRVLQSSGAEEIVFGLNTDSFDGLRIPADVAVDGQGNIFVVDTERSRFVVFDSDGAFQYTWGEEGTGDGQFLGAGGIALGPEGSIYTIDWKGNRLQKFQITGDFPPAT